MIKVLIVDDQTPVQDFLKKSLESESGLEIVGTANNGKIAIQQVAALKPDVVLMDIDMPGIDGLTATKVISERFADTKVLILSMHEEDSFLDKALQVGAKGYLLKNTPSVELINAIYSAYNNYFQLGPGLLEKYLYKFVQNQSNVTEVEQLKTMIDKQDKILAKIQNREDFGDRKKTNKPDEEQYKLLSEGYTVLKNQIDLVQFRQEKINQQLVLLQNFCVFLTVALAIAILGVIGFAL
jgi:DNA-binding NarL/FixJ family response regulator